MKKTNGKQYPALVKAPSGITGSSCRRGDAIMIKPRCRARRCEAATTSGPRHGLTTATLIETDDAVLYEAHNGGRERLFVSSREAMSALIV